MAFMSASPNIGVGAIPKQPSVKSASPWKVPKSIGEYYSDLVHVCMASSVSVDTFLCPVSHPISCCVEIMGHASVHTGGQCTKINNFDVQRDYEKLYRDVHRSISRSAGFDVVFKLRCSIGLSVEKSEVPWNVASSLMNGYLPMKALTQFGGGNDPSYFRMPRLDGDTSLVFHLKHCDQ
eukprot:Selendium_serpulae@DN5755_c0_g1_i10.p2